MDENQFEGAAKDLGGSVKSTVGNLTGDAKLEAEGTADQIVGTAQRAYGKVKDQASGVGSAAADQLDDISALIGDTVAERPLTALLVAGAIGYALARRIGR
jgi:uncharacterized protein YjbJ (UPF0337 family)